MDLNVDEPIAALASAPGGAMRGIVRISGVRVSDVLSHWFKPLTLANWETARTASSHSGTIVLDDDDSQPVECPVRVMYWPNRRSYTGQPLVELHLPGSPSLLEMVLHECYRHGARPARPGEFTLRAFLAGKLDLLQAEAVLGVIDAQNQIELQTALSQLAGGVSGRLGELRRDLLELLADLEAGLDFVDEDIEFVSRKDILKRLTVAWDFVRELLQQTQERMQSSVRPKAVLAGLPNAGKSTLFNRLAGVHTALVSPEQGTTRDFLTRPITWDGLTFDLVDTAGWEDAATGIGAAAQQQRTTQLQQSQLLIWCSSATLSPAETILDDRLFEECRQHSPAAIRLQTKSDLLKHCAHFCSNPKKESPEPNPLPARPGRGGTSTIAQGDLATQVSTDMTLVESIREPSIDVPLEAGRNAGTTSSGSISFSSVSDLGFFELQKMLRQQLSVDRPNQSQWLGTTAARCRETLEQIAASLERARLAATTPETGDELIAVDLREGLNQLGVILGAIYTDDLLDRIFSKFCIGK